MEIYKKLLRLQKHLSFVSKKSEAQGYNYTSGEELFSKVRPKMDELGLMLFHEVVDTEHEHVIWKTKYSDKQQTYVICKMRFTWVDAESGETLSHEFSASGFNDWDKALGSALTYAERYYVLKQFHIPTGEDDPDERKEPEKPESATNAQIKLIVELAKELKISEANVAKVYSKEAIGSLTKEDADDCIKRLKIKKENENATTNKK